MSLGWADLEEITLEMGQGGGERSTGAKEESRTSRRSVSPAQLPFPPGSLPGRPALEATLPPPTSRARAGVQQARHNATPHFQRLS